MKTLKCNKNILYTLKTKILETIFLKKNVIYGKMFAIYIIHQNLTIIGRDMTKENRTYIRGEFRESVGMNFFSPFQPEREFKVYKSCKCSQIICSRVH